MIYTELPKFTHPLNVGQIDRFKKWLSLGFLILSLPTPEEDEKLIRQIHENDFRFARMFHPNGNLWEAIFVVLNCSTQNKVVAPYNLDKLKDFGLEMGRLYNLPSIYLCDGTNDGEHIILNDKVPTDNRFDHYEQVDSNGKPIYPYTGPGSYGERHRRGFFGEMFFGDTIR